MNNPLFSIITIVNKTAIFNDFKKELNKQDTSDYELIVINNENNQYDSARDAYRSAIYRCKGKYLMFVHPDIRFLDSSSLSDIFKQVLQIKNFGVIGVAGCPENFNSIRGYTLTSMLQGMRPHHFGVGIDRATKVQTVDECCFIMKKEFYETIPFSNIKGWHLYAVEQCLRSIIKQKENYVIPAKIWHMSPGFSEDREYVKCGIILVKKYGDFFSNINTTVTSWKTHGYFVYIIPWIKHYKRIIFMKLHLKR